MLPSFLRRSLALLLVLALLVGVWYLAESVIHARAFVQAMRRTAELVEVERRSSTPSLGAAREQLTVARRELESLRPLGATTAQLAERLAGFPVVGPWAGRVAAVWTAAEETTTLGEALADGAQRGSSILADGQGAAGLVEASTELGSYLRTALASLSRLQRARERLSNLPWPFDRFEPLLLRWDAVAQPMSQALAEAQLGLAAAPTALGTERPVTYLVLIQASDELRASGGFITSVGTIRLDRGRVVGQTFQKVYAAEGIDVPSPADTGGFWLTPPWPFGRYMGLGQWRLRDANWWADFPSTARQAAEFWTGLHGEQVDGVVAVNERAIETILDAVGPVTLADGQAISAANLRQATIERVFRGDTEAEWYGAQSAFSQELGGALLTMLQAPSLDRLLGLARRLQAEAPRRDLLVSSFAPTPAALLHRYGLDGALRGEQDDYLYLVEQNVSYGKLSPFVEHDLTYAVDLDADARPLRAELTVEARNGYAAGKGYPGYPATYYDGLRWNEATRQLDPLEGYYGGYTRLLIPHGSSFGGASGYDEGPFLDSEGGRLSIGGYLGLAMGSERRVHLEWQPQTVPSRAGSYRLVVQRQPGSEERQIEVRVRLPRGSQLAEAQPPPNSVEGNLAIWSARLSRDFELELRPRASS